MAVDTRDKRASALALTIPWRWLLPLPDNTVGAADRQQVAYMYSGILATEAVDTGVPGTPAGVDVYFWNVPRDQYGWTVKADTYLWTVKRDRVEI